MKKIIYILFMGIVAGCATIHNTSTMTMDIPQTYSSTETDSISWASVGWKEFFADKNLIAIIDTALINNFDIQQAIKNVEIASNELWRIKAEWLPNFGFSATSSVGTDIPNNWKLAGQFSWEIDVWGKICNKKQAVRATYMQSEEGVRAIKSSIIAQTASAYYTLCLLNEKEKMIKQQIQLSDSLVATQELYYKTGKTDKVSLQQTRAQRAQMYMEAEKIKQSKTSVLHTLSILIGKADVSSFINEEEYVNSMPGEYLRNGINIGLPSQLLSNRPDLRAAENELQIRNAEIGIAKKNFYPSVNISGNGGFTSGNISSIFSNGLLGAIDGIVGQKLFNRRNLRADYKKAIIEKEKAEVNFKQTFLKAYNEVSLTLDNICHLNTQLNYMDDRCEELGQATYDAMLMYRHGKEDFFRVLSIRQNMLYATLEYEETKCAYLLAIVELYRALGGGTDLAHLSVNDLKVD